VWVFPLTLIMGEVTKQDYDKYDVVALKGEVNMMDVKAISKATGLDHQKIFTLMKHYTALGRKFYPEKD
jgi:hypothetical protein